MKREMLFAAAILIAVSATPALAGNVNVNIGVSPPVVVQPAPPPVVVQPIPPPPGSITVVPALPPGVVITSGPAVYWFWDNNVNMWFYFGPNRHRHYVEDHVYVDDGHHYYVHGGRWAVGHADEGRHLGWYKHQERREYRHEKNLERQEYRHERNLEKQRYKHDKKLEKQAYKQEKRELKHGDGDN